MLTKLADFLAKYKIKPPSEVVREQVKVALLTELEFEIPLTSIKIEKSVVYIQVSPAARNEIFMHKDALLEAVNKKLSNTRISDIR